MMNKEIYKLIEYAKTGKVLNLSGQGIIELPKEIWNLTHLTRLSLRHNEIEEIPKGIAKLTQLKELWLDGNKLSILPNEIGKLTSLKCLSLSDNQLTDIPEDVRKLKYLEILNLQGNLIELPKENLSKRPISLIDYVLQHQERRRINEIKLMVLGPRKSGKTALIKRLIERAFTESPKIQTGITVQRWPIQIAHKRVQLNIWDFGTAEIENGIQNFFLTQRSFYLLVWDALKEKTSTDIEFWLKPIQHFGGGSPVIVVLNKTDIGTKEIDRHALQAKYPMIKAFVNVSAKNGDGINQLRDFIKKAIFPLENLQEDWEFGWLSTKTRIEVTKNNVMSLVEFRALAEKEKIDNASQMDLLQWMHDLGLITHFQEDLQLKSKLILKPEWLSNAILAILNAKSPIRNKGILSTADLSWLLNETTFPHQHYLFIINIMKKYELCFALDDSNNQDLIIPQWLPLSPNNINWHYKESLIFYYQYQYYPEPIIPKVIAKLYPFIHKDFYWRDGFIIDGNDNQALVLADAQNAKIAIYVSGRHNTRRDFLAQIRFSFEYLHTLFPQIVVQEQVPIPGFPDYPVDYQHLIHLEENGVENYMPDGLNEEIPIKELLYGMEGSYRYFQQKIKGLQQELNELNNQIESIWLLYAQSFNMGKQVLLEKKIKISELKRDSILLEIDAFEQALAEDT